MRNPTLPFSYPLTQKLKDRDLAIWKLDINSAWLTTAAARAHRKEPVLVCKSALASIFVWKLIIHHQLVDIHRVQTRHLIDHTPQQCKEAALVQTTIYIFSYLDNQTFFDSKTNARQCHVKSWKWKQNHWTDIKENSDPNPLAFLFKSKAYWKFQKINRQWWSRNITVCL